MNTLIQKPAFTTVCKDQGHRKLFPTICTHILMVNNSPPRPSYLPMVQQRTSMSPHVVAKNPPSVPTPTSSTIAQRGDESCVPPAALRAVLLSLRTGGLTGAERAKIKADQRLMVKEAEEQRAAEMMTAEVGKRLGHCGRGIALVDSVARVVYEGGGRGLRAYFAHRSLYMVRGVPVGRAIIRREHWTSQTHRCVRHLSSLRFDWSH